MVQEAEDVEILAPVHPHAEEIPPPRARAFPAPPPPPIKPPPQKTPGPPPGPQEEARARGGGLFPSPRGGGGPGSGRSRRFRADLLDRRVEITGPVDRKMIINALNSGANVFMADFEDSNAPTWANNIEGQINLRDAVRARSSRSSSPAAKQYALNEKTATLLVRPRGWHLPEKHVLVDGEPVSGIAVRLRRSTSSTTRRS